jgi:hypothetical protein
LPPAVEPLTALLSVIEAPAPPLALLLPVPPLPPAALSDAVAVLFVLLVAEADAELIPPPLPPVAPEPVALPPLPPCRLTEVEADELPLDADPEPAAVPPLPPLPFVKPALPAPPPPPLTVTELLAEPEVAVVVAVALPLPPLPPAAPLP